MENLPATECGSDSSLGYSLTDDSHVGNGASKMAAMNDVTQILSQIESGDPTAAEQLLPLVYAELWKLAAAKLAQEQPGQELEAMTLTAESGI